MFEGLGQSVVWAPRPHAISEFVEPVEKGGEEKKQTYKGGRADARGKRQDGRKLQHGCSMDAADAGRTQAAARLFHEGTRHPGRKRKGHCHSKPPPTCTYESCLLACSAFACSLCSLARVRALYRIKRRHALRLALPLSIAYCSLRLSTGRDPRQKIRGKGKRKDETNKEITEVLQQPAQLQRVKSNLDTIVLYWGRQGKGRERKGNKMGEGTLQRAKIHREQT